MEILESLFKEIPIILTIILIGFGVYTEQFYLSIKWISIGNYSIIICLLLYIIIKSVRFFLTIYPEFKKKSNPSSK